MNPEPIDQIATEIDQLDKMNRPKQLLKKALSSVLIVVMIGAGFVVNFVMALIFAFKGLGAVVWWQYIGGLVLLLAAFPALYIFFAISYAKSVVIWEAYREVLRPLVAKLFGRTLDFYLVENPDSAAPMNESRIVEEVEKRQKHFLERLPDFLRAYVQIFFTGKDIVKIVRAQRQSGAEKEEVKRKSMESFFESLDLQISELAEPSLLPFVGVAIANVVLVYFLF
jgi:hypothetical protein